MAQHYTPIWDDWPKVTQELNDQEKGRLIDAIVLYAAGGEWQERIKGNERYLFPAFREQVNRGNQVSDIRATAGSKPKQTGTKANKTEQTETKRNKKHEEEKEEEEEKENKNKKNSTSPLFGFDAFWPAYPKKTAKQDAIRAFGKIRPDEALLQVILKAVETQKASAQWQEDGGHYIPHPATWLNGRRWEDEVRPVPTQGAGSVPRAVAAQAYEQREYSPEAERPEDMLRRLQEQMGG